MPFYSPASSVPGEDGENGGDAVIDIDDNDTADDEPVLGVPHQEVDYLKRSGAAPTFLIWTGPRYRFSSGLANNGLTASAPCNKQYMVEAATDENFTMNLVTGGWTSLPTAGVPCFVRLPLPPTQWDTLKGGTVNNSCLYRVTTRMSSMSSSVQDIISTSPRKRSSVGTPALCHCERDRHLNIVKQRPSHRGRSSSYI